MRRILVTGASGFVGGRLVDRLSEEQNLEALLAVGGPGPDAGLMLDILDDAAVDGVIADFAPTDIVHLAAASSVAGAGQAPEVAWDVNLIGVRNLAAAARRLPAVRFLFASTAEVYGRAFLAGPCSEDTPPEPASTYARTKLAAEHLLEDFSGDRLRVTALRLFNHTGPGQDTRFVVPAFAAQIAAIERGQGQDNVIRVGNLDARRDFTDVDDIIAAYMAVLRSPGEEKGFVRYNVGSGQERTIASILDRMIGLSDRPIDVVQDPARMRPSEITLASGRFDRFRDRFGWSIQTRFEQTVADVLEDQRRRVRTAHLGG